MLKIDKEPFSIPFKKYFHIPVLGSAGQCPSIIQYYLTKSHNFCNFQDVARMTDDLAMDLDLDGPEKNVYVVNPQKPVNFNVSFHLRLRRNCLIQFCGTLNCMKKGGCLAFKHISIYSVKFMTST